jgi:hypothetical protein
LIKEGEWDTKELTEMRENLLEVLQIKHDPVNNEVIMKKLSALEELEKSYYEKLDKLEELDNKLEKLDKYMQNNFNIIMLVIIIIIGSLELCIVY